MQHPAHQPQPPLTDPPSHTSHSLSPQSQAGLQGSAQNTSLIHLPHFTNQQCNRRTTDNCCHPPAHLHPPRPSSFQASRAPSHLGRACLLMHCSPSCAFLPHPPTLSPFLLHFILGKHGRIATSSSRGLASPSQPQVSAELEFIRDHPQWVCWSLLHPLAGHGSDIKHDPAPG